MNRFKISLFAATALASVSAGSANAQEAPAQGAAVTDEIIVTARRSQESLQNVPVSVSVISRDTVLKLGITRSEEVAKLAPGLTLTPPNTAGSNQAIILRGVRWSPASGAPAVPVYLNEASFGPNVGLSSLFDIGQIEVLRGPQGTSRGAPSISGAITVSTRRPNLGEFGGYVQGVAGTHDHYGVQGAVNLPVVRDVLGLRIAGNYDTTRGNNVSSVNSTEKPKIEQKQIRVSALFTPTDTVEVFAMYQHTATRGGFFTQVAGSGSPGVPALGIRAGYNGPVITAQQQLAVGEQRNVVNSDDDIVTVNAKWDVLGHTLSYNYGGEWGVGRGVGREDVANQIPGFDGVPTNNVPHGRNAIHEIRLSSQRGSHLIDYDIGYYNFFANAPTSLLQHTYLSGAFGFTPGSVTSPLSRYTLPIGLGVSIQRKEESAYGSVQLHLPSDIELTGGIRHITDHTPLALNTTIGAGFINLGTPASIDPRLTGFPCAFLGFVSPALAGVVDSPSYAGTCDLPIAAGTINESYANRHTATIWNVSASKKFGDDILAYATVGTSYRGGLPAVANTGLPVGLSNPNPEKATSYEVGLKTTLAPGIRFNIAAYQINYKGQLTTFQGIQYYNTTSGQVSTTNLAFFRNVDARVRGVEAELGLKPLDGLSLNATASYAKITSQGGVIPCNDSVARPITAANPINTCASAKGQDLTPSPYFQANLNGSYDMPINDQLSGYVRFNLNYQGKSKNFGTSTRPTSAYAITDLFAGVTGGDGAWEVGAFAKNIFNVRKELTRLPIDAMYAPFGATGYDQVSTTLPSEVGIQLRYAFGSR
ncbi:TonB-dependent receptor [Novosphingobium bradum]|uniref:TonB-dependent receptor n=1 Tax=Novosphingobium bradum TaxID=1737444 RepID=A0ABV7IQ80_9SPHN